MKLMIQRLVCCLAFLAAAGSSPAAHAQTTTLRYSNWFPVGQAIRVDVIEPWLAEIEKVTQGRVKIETMPKVVGSLPAQFDVARDGQPDLVVFVPGYTPNRFDIIEGAQLPFMSDNPEVYGPAVDRFYRKHVASFNEFKGVHPLSVFTVSPGQLFNSKRAMKSLADFKGLKIRSPQASATQALSLLGGVPVAKPVSETYELLSSGVLDGTFMPPESIPVWKLTELISYATIIPGAIYNTILVMAINEDKWKSLRAEDREAITRISGDTFARDVGRVYAKGDAAAFDQMRKAGKSVEILPDQVVAEMKRVLQPIERDWAAKVAKKGVKSPDQLIQSLRDELAASR